jgi:hypothetical protein
MAVGVDRLERVWDLGVMRTIRAHAEPWQTYGGEQVASAWLPRAFSWAKITHMPMPHGLFGCVAVRNSDTLATRWGVSLNDRLPTAAANATLGHEIAHTFWPALMREGAFCVPRRGLPTTEQLAHAGGALLTVPASAIADLRFGDEDARDLIAVRHGVPSTFVDMRHALAVFLAEKRGDERDASAYLNGAMLRHQLWMARISDLMRAGAENPPVSVA